ncbi:hypothetical protein CFC21_085917 [Triticum aestivum]|uniref:Uncharacterized protein n=2 Tax=Triticum aestivum TaxID=4565 RepID=A0A9R1IE44_WHEAT|nr:hypothetical protein CFC21_085917 [Triticum aestivum]
MASSSAAVVAVLAFVVLGMGAGPAAAKMACKGCPTYCSSMCNSTIRGVASSSNWYFCNGPCGSPTNCVEGCKSSGSAPCLSACANSCSPSAGNAYCSSYCAGSCSRIDYETACKSRCCPSRQQCNERINGIIQTCTTGCNTGCQANCVTA